MAEATEFYYGDGDQQRGPFSRDQIGALLQAGSINGSTLVWCKGMTGWLPLSQSPLAAMASPLMAPRAPLAAPSPAPAYQGLAAAAPSAMGAQAGYGGGYTGGYGEPLPPPVSTFGQAIRAAWSNYANFSGRANRPEYWYTVLFVLLLSIAAQVLDYLMSRIGIAFPIFYLIVVVAWLVPNLAVTVRRLHDTDRTGWWLLIVLVPLVGSIVLIVFCCLKGTDGPNRFGT